jgi:ectoine hydroxylase-related dioxygenase (phytanoyl-CoA dioxygenase family)
MTSLSTCTPDTLSTQQIDFYRENGFVHIPGIINPEEVETFRRAALEVSEVGTDNSGSAIFKQIVNVWTQNEAMKSLTLHPNVAAVAQKLAGVDLRLWHDQTLIKKPHNAAPTEFHQDQPYWPHQNSLHSISCWIALCDVPVERGCMTFIPKSQRLTQLPPQNLGDPSSLFGLAPDLVWEPRITVPLRAGDCTFHHGRCAHMATPNFTDEPRVAHVVIFMDEGTLFDGSPHVVTQKLGLEIGKPFAHALFPLVADFASISSASS